MRKFVFTVLLFALVSASSAGTISGTFIFECAEPTTYTIAYASAFTVSSISSGDFMSAPYDIVVPPWDYEITYDFDDDSEYYAVGSVIIGDISDITDGNPMGMFPGSPFHTVGGAAEDVDIVLDDTVDITIGVNVVGGAFENIYVNIYDAVPYFLAGGDPTLEITLPMEDTIQTISDVPAGPKYIQFFKDLNDDGVWDEEEHSVYIETPESNLVFAVGGFYDTLRATLDLSEIVEKSVPGNMLALDVSPSPFNSSARIEISGISDDAFVEISDVSGRIVYRNEVAGNLVFEWKPKNLAGGLYFVNLFSGENRIIKRIVYMP